jgi:hypothetical protein
MWDRRQPLREGALRTAAALGFRLTAEQEEFLYERSKPLPEWERPKDTPEGIQLLTALEDDILGKWKVEAPEGKTVLSCRCGVRWEGDLQEMILGRIFSRWAEEHREGKPSRIDPGRTCGPERRLLPEKTS